MGFGNLPVALELSSSVRSLRELWFMNPHHNHIPDTGNLWFICRCRAAMEMTMMMEEEQSWRDKDRGEVAD